MTSWAKFSRQYLLSPNGLSLVRGVIGLSLPFLILSPRPVYHFTAFLLFIIGALTDYWDGFLARRYSLESAFGKFIDPLMDKILILAPLSAFAVLQFYSPWWLVPIFVREIVVTFCRIGWMIEGKVLGAEKLGKYKLGFQLVLTLSAFFYLLGSDYTSLAGLAPFFRRLMGFLLWGTGALTVISGATFLYHCREYFMTERFARFVSATGVGLIPFIPGTWGSLLGLGIVFLVHWNLWLYLLTFTVLVWVGYWAVERVDLTQNKDPHFIVIDEVCGIMVAFLGMPLNISTVLLSFFLFRVLDVLKPYPLRSLERLPRYWGILCDDLGAGVYTWLAVQILMQLRS